MDPFELSRQVADRAVRTPQKVGQAPYRAVQLAAAEPGETPYDVVYEEHPVRLRRYEPRADEVRSAPVVIAYAFINDPSILDFAPDRSIVRALLERGFPVYVVDWGDPSPIDRSLGLGDYVVRYLDNCVEAARGAHDAASVHVLGYSTGAPLAAAYAALFPDRVRTLVLQGPPLNFDAGDCVALVRTLAANFDYERLAEVFNAVPTPLLEAGLSLRKPLEYGATTPLRLWDRLDDDAFVEGEGRKVEWAAGGPAIPATMFREFVEELLLENRLIENELSLFDRRVDLSAIEMPVMLVLGQEDAFVPREASVPFLDEVGSDDTAVVEFPTGHVGLSVARSAHERGWPRVYDWLEERSS